MQDIENLKLQLLGKQGVKTLVDWAREEGWNPGEHDLEVFHRTDPEGFYGFYIDDELIGGGAVVSYKGEFGFMGLFIVRPDLRGRGIGEKLWHLRRDLLIQRLNKDAAIGMDGVVAMQPFYEKGGFRIAFRDERYECYGRKTDPDEHVSVILTADRNRILEYDKGCFGFDRTVFMNEWLSMPDSRAFKYTMGDDLLGFTVIRKVHSGYKIGPLFADDEKVAEALYLACLDHAPDQPVYLDVPVPNESALNMMKKYDARYVFECARMYHGKPPGLDIDKIFGITTFELG